MGQDLRPKIRVFLAFNAHVNVYVTESDGAIGDETGVKRVKICDALHMGNES